MLAVLVYAQSRRSTGRAPPVTFATDVCLAHPPECDGPDQFTARMVPRTYALRSGRRVEHHAGVSVMLVSKHGDTHAFDWSNLLHWSSAMLYSSLVVQSNSLELRARLRAATAASRGRANLSALGRTLLPTIPASTSVVHCSGAESSGTPAYMARGAHSEMFALLAQAASLSIANALGIAAPPRPPLALCTPRLIHCFDGLLSFQPKGGSSFKDRLGRWNREMLLTGRMQQAGPNLLAAPFLAAAYRLAGSSPPAVVLPRPRRRVVLLTRRTQSRWTNRPEAVRELRAIATGAGVGFVDAGDAEALGRTNLPGGGACYAARPQIELWRDAWLVISVVGAHESNLLFMPSWPQAAGLLESTNCGFFTDSYSTLARAVGTGHHRAQQLNARGRQCLPSTSQDYHVLNSPREMDLRNDTLGSLLRFLVLLPAPPLATGLLPGKLHPFLAARQASRARAHWQRPAWQRQRLQGRAADRRTGTRLAYAYHQPAAV